jgi:hypothetical protein
MGICDDARKQGFEKVNAAYDPTLNELGTVIANMTKIGADPTKYYDIKNNEVVDFVAMFKDLDESKKTQIEEVDSKVTNECDQTMEFLQGILDMVISSYTRGLSVVLPKHMTHIDVEEILSGKPLGGDNSIFNEIRDKVFDFVQIDKDNDLRKIISNPAGEAKDFINDVIRGLGIQL